MTEAIVEAIQCPAKRDHHTTWLHPFHTETRKGDGPSSHFIRRQTDRCCACPKSMVVSALDYITPICYATPPAHEIARDIL